MKFFATFTIFLIGIVYTNAQLSPEASAALVEAGVEVYKETINNLKEGVSSLFIAEELTKVASSLAQLNAQLEAKQTAALKTILDININAQLAIDASRLVVTKVKNMCSTLITILDVLNTEEGLKIAIETFVSEAKLLEPDVNDAVTKLTSVAAKAINVDAAFIILNRWAEIKKEEIKVLTQAEIDSAREKAYGGAAACIGTGPYAIFVCPVAYAIAAGVTEGKNVKEIEEAFDAAISHINDMKAEIKSIGEKTDALVVRVKADKDRMVTIQGQFTEAKNLGGLALQLYDKLFSPFKASVTTLHQSCVSFLAQRDSAMKKLDVSYRGRRSL